MRTKLAAAAVACTLATAGCTAPPPGDKATWDDPADNACPVYFLPTLPPFSVLDRPPPTNQPPNYRYQTISFDVRALADQFDPAGYERCAPVAVHVMVTGADASAVTLVLPDGTQTGVPYDVTTTTPWVGAFVIVGYPDTGQVPPTYTATLDVTYLKDRDDPNAHTPGIRCAIALSGQETTYQENRGDITRFAHCAHTGRTYRPS